MAGGKRASKVKNTQFLRVVGRGWKLFKAPSEILFSSMSMKPKCTGFIKTQTSLGLCNIRNMKKNCRKKTCQFMPQMNAKL